MKTRKVFLVSLTVISGLLASAARGAELRIGMIGLDTSHVTAFTELLNDVHNPEHIPGARVVAAVKGGSPDIPASYKRVDRFTREMQTKYGVRIVPTIRELCHLVDVVMVESVDGRPHWKEARPVILAHKPLFVDKPLAGSLRDAVRIYQLAKKEGVPIFSSSAYRYYHSMVTLEHTDVGKVRGAVSYGPCHLEPHHPDLFWYGVHPTEALFTILGSGCQTVTRTTTKDIDVVTGVWSGGRVGTLIGLRTGATPHKVIVFGTHRVAEQGKGDDYAPLVRQIIHFFQTGVAPVPPEQTMEIYAFMAAADVSKHNGGSPVSVPALLKKNGYQF